MKPSDAPTWTNFPSKVAEYIVDNPILVASEIAIIPVGWITIKWWLGKRFRQRVIFKLIDFMLTLRSILIYNIDSQGNLRLPEPERMFDTLGLGNILDLADFIRIQDLIGKLSDLYFRVGNPPLDVEKMTDKRLSF